MNKILLIISREYFTRVKKKSFLMVTFLVPVLFMLMVSLTVYFAINQGGLGDVKKVKVVDESGWFTTKLKDSKTIHYTFTTDFAATKSTFIKDEYDFLLYITPNFNSVQIFGEKTPSMIVTNKIESDLDQIAQARRLSDAHIDTAVLAAAQKSINLIPVTVSENGDKNTNIAAPYSVGLLCAVLIYMSLFLYGAQVMRGVIEEKVSRIVEVIISSVKPFQLMIGKIIGVGMVGLTQFLLWILLTFTLSSVAGTAFMAKNAVGLQQMEQSQSTNEARNTTSISKSATDDESAQGFLTALQSLPVTLIVCCFLFYFVFGYMLYSALFAAVGSAVDNETETQQFMIPVTLPLIFTFMLSQSVIINNPDSSLAVWLSMIPFTSPIAMMIRLPFGVPAWQIAVSMALMIVGFLGTTWVAARIYRVGILMYGKKATYKELARWFMYKD